MKINNFFKYRIVFILAISFFICFYSCSKEELVPEKAFYSILKEVHNSKGILSFTDINNMYAGRDSLSAYDDIYNKYGYSRETVENTYRYYFVHKTKSLKKFYNSFLGELSAEEARIIEERSKMMFSDLPATSNRTDFKLSLAKVEDKAYFERQLLSTGLYNLSFDVRVDPSDPTYKPYFSLWMRPAGGNLQDSELITTVSYIKDGNTYHIIIPLEKRERPAYILYGYFYDTDGDPVIGGKNAEIKNLKIVYVQ